MPERLQWPRDRVEALLAAMRSVATVDAPLGRVERGLIEGARDHVFGLDMDIDDLPGVSPDALAAALTDADQRELAVQFLVLVPYADMSVDAPEVARVDAYATALGASPKSLSDLHHIRDHHIRRLALDYGRRSIGAFAGDGFGARSRAIVRSLHEYVGDARTADRFAALAGYGSGTLGRTFYEFYRDRGFPLPGEKHSLGEYFVGHDSAHILAGFNTDGAGELSVAGFEAGMIRDGFGFEMLMEVMLDFQLGIEFGTELVGYAVKTGELDPDELMVGIQRGLGCDVDLIRGWDFWAAAGDPVVDLRVRYGIEGVDGVELDPPDEQRVDWRDEASPAG